MNYFYYLNIDTSSNFNFNLKSSILSVHKLREFSNEKINSLAGAQNEIHLSTEIHENTVTILAVSTLSNQIYAKYCI